MKITFIRHAEIEEQYQGCYNGHIDIGLSPNGYTQAKKLTQKMKNQNFDAIYCSDLLRAKETLKQFNLTQTVIFTEKLREKSWGKHEGLSYDEIVQKDGIQYKNFLQWIETLDGQKIPSYVKQVEVFLYKEILPLNKKNILIVTHSGFMKTILHIINKESLEKSFSSKVAYLSTINILYNEKNLKII